MKANIFLQIVGLVALLGWPGPCLANNNRSSPNRDGVQTGLEASLSKSGVTEAKPGANQSNQEIAGDLQTDATKRAIWKAEFFARAGRFSKAIELQNNILKSDPNNYQVLSERGFCYGRSGDYKKALADLNRSVQLNPRDHIGYYLRGNVYSMMKNENNAIKDFTTSLQLYEPLSATREARAKSYARVGQTQKAIDDYTTLIDSASKRASAHATRLLLERAAIYEKLGQQPKAMADYDAAIEKSPQYATAYQRRADAYTHQKNYQKALEDYTKAISINRSDLRPVYYGRAAAYQKLGNTKLAAVDLKAAKQWSRER